MGSGQGQILSSTYSLTCRGMEAYLSVFKIVFNTPDIYYKENPFFPAEDNWGEEEEEEEDDEMEEDQEVPVKKVKAPGQKKVRKEHLNVVFIGHVGKSEIDMYS